MPEWKDISGQVPLLVAIAIGAIVAVKLLPTLLSNRKETRQMELANAKEIQLAEIAVRDKEASARLAQAEATNTLTGQLKASAEVTEELSIFLKRANELAAAASGRLAEMELEMADIRKVVTGIIENIKGGQQK